MAVRSSTISWNNLNSSQLDKFDKVLYDQIYNDNMALRKMRAMSEKWDGGSNMVIPLEYAMMPAGSFSTGYETITPTDTEFISNCTVPKIRYYVNIAVSKPEMDDNKGEGKILDLMERKYAAAKKTMEYYLNSGLMSDGSAASGTGYNFLERLYGLRYWLATDPTTGTVAGINRATYLWFRNQIKDETTSGVPGLTLAKIQTLHGLCTDGAEMPNLGLTTQTIYNQLWSLADTKMRLGTEETAKLGYPAISFNGTPIVVDKNCPADRLYFLNTKYFKFFIGNDIEAGPWLQGPTQPFAMSKTITFSGNLACTNPRYQGVLFTAA